MGMGMNIYEVKLEKLPRPQGLAYQLRKTS